MIKLHGTNGSEIHINREHIVSVEMDCYAKETLIIVDAMKSCGQGVANVSYKVMESPEEIILVAKGELLPSVIEEKYGAKFNAVRLERSII